ncbi:MAG: phospholipase D-like domain-containing protein [Holosporaceae bacterium]
MQRLVHFLLFFFVACTGLWAPVHVFPEAGRLPYVQMIQEAKESLDLMIYVIDDRAIRDALVEAHQRGVNMRVLIEKQKYDHDETQSSSDQTVTFLEQAGIPLKKTPDHVAQVHAKLLIQDGVKALISTGNMDEESFDGLPGIGRPARDFAIEITHPEVLADLQTVFQQDWEAKPTDNLHNVVLAPGSYRGWILEKINNAQQSLEMYQQDFTDKNIQEAVLRAIDRGVKVALIMTPHPFSKDWDHNIPFQQKLEAKGATVRLKDDLYIHAKLVLIDRGTPGALALLGTSNFYAPSLDSNREIALQVTDKEDLKTFFATFDQDIKPVA